MAPPFEILSLRDTGAGGVWAALLLEGERLARVEFACDAASDEEMRAQIGAIAARFRDDASALEQFRALTAG